MFREKWSFPAALLVFGALFGLFIYLVPMMSDDLFYTLKADTRYVHDNPFAVSPDSPIVTVGDVFSSQWVQYHIIGGRMVVHLLAQLLLCFVPRILSCALIGLMAAFLAVQMGRCAFGKLTGEARFMYFLPFLFLLLWETQDIFGHISYCCNYIYAPAVILWFWNRFSAENRGGGWGLLPLAFFAGWSHEGFLLCLAPVVGLHYLINCRKLDGLRHAAFALFVIGACAAVFAPGNFARQEQDENLFPLSLDTLCLNLELCRPLLVAALVAAVVGVIRWQWLREWTRERHNLLLLLGIIVGWSVAASQGMISLRQAAGADYLASILLASLLNFCHGRLHEGGDIRRFARGNPAALDRNGNE